jgi:N-acetyl-gamma-glutamyl-phosphate/LysW-gamma-L-alpha-aminoadipyl-6-phosphate reductase
MRASVVGAAGYVGGEALRILLGHEHVDVVHATSDSHAGEPVHAVHPNLRGITELDFVPHDAIEPVDVLFVALPHGRTHERIGKLAGAADLLIDLSADFRLRDARLYETLYRTPHPCPDELDGFTTGIPELHRDELRGAKRVSVPGCMANASILALYPLAKEGLVDGPAIVDCRSGSSGSGRAPSPASHHVERAGAMRVYQPVGHRHHAEIEQACGIRAQMTATAVEAVRGVQAVIHVRPSNGLAERDVWTLYRSYYGDEPFVRLVNQRRGVNRLPDPKLLAGSNFCDIGFSLEPDGSRLVLVSALDNLVKGGAGNAVQCMNVAAGLPERAGLGFPGLHPM